MPSTPESQCRQLEAGILQVQGKSLDETVCGSVGSRRHNGVHSKEELAD
jgi:hypothetical protein